MIKEVYREIEIVLLEEENKWRFTANGRERTAPSLPKAREYIDNALDAIATKKEKPWEPIEAYYLERYPYTTGALDKGRITSLADRDYRNRQNVWFNGERQGRRKVSVEDLCVASPENETIFGQLKAIENEEAEIKLRFRKTADAIKRVELPEIQAASE